MENLGRCFLVGVGFEEELRLFDFDVTNISLGFCDRDLGN